YAKNTDYFYQNLGGVVTDNNIDYPLYFEDFSPKVSLYFYGAFDERADIERSGGTASTDLPSDEKFLYAMGWGEGFISDNGETEQRNYLGTVGSGGFMILRYFDDKIGGTISGYTGTSAWNNRAYREVNLQGDFTVERNTTVASGATLNLLKNTNLNPISS